MSIKPRRVKKERRPDPNRFALTVQEAADKIGVSRSKLWERIKADDLESFLSCGRRLIRPDALLDMLARDEAASRAA